MTTRPFLVIGGLLMMLATGCGTGGAERLGTTTVRRHRGGTVITTTHTAATREAARLRSLGLSPSLVTKADALPRRETVVPSPPLFVTRSTIEDILEAVLRWNLTPPQGDPPIQEPTLYVKLPKELDSGAPSAEFLARFKDVPRRLASYTEAVLEETVLGDIVAKERGSSERAYMCELDQVLFIFEEEAVVFGINRAPHFLAEVRTKYLVKRRDGRWSANRLPFGYFSRFN